MSHLNVGGIPRYVLSLAEQQTKRGHRVIIASDGGRLADDVPSLGATHWPYPFRTSFEFSPRVMMGARHLAERLRQEPVDVIHAHTRVSQVVADRVSRATGIPYITTWHGIYPARLGRRLWPCTGHRTIAISGLVERHLRDAFHLPSTRIRRVFNGIDYARLVEAPPRSAIEEARRRWGIPPNVIVVGGMGRLAAGEVKGFDLLLVAAYALRQEFPDVHVLIAGDGPRRPFLEDIARRLKIRDHVHFMGTAEDVRLPLAVMDLFIFSSRWPEAFGLTVVEAMAAGKAVVAANSGAVPEIIRHQVDGWLVKPSDPGALAEGIARLLRDEELRRRMRKEARRRVHDLFTVERMTAGIEAVYREVI